jgi:hypothetical protein
VVTDSVFQKESPEKNPLNPLERSVKTPPSTAKTSRKINFIHF